MCVSFKLYYIFVCDFLYVLYAIYVYVLYVLYAIYVYVLYCISFCVCVCMFAVEIVGVLAAPPHGWFP